MSDNIQIYGSIIKLPLRPKNEDAINYGLPRKEQKWSRGELPAMFDKVEYDKSGNLILTPEQEKYASEEVRRCKEGVWMWIGDKMRYIPRRYYFYLKYYTLEDGNAPEFREADRLWFIFHEYWFNILWCLFIIRTKKRRQGASSQACSNILYEAIFFKNSNCGLVSKTKDDSKDTFTQMITAAYRLLPAFLKPKQVNKEDSVTELVFAHKSQTVKAGYAAGVREEEGHNSKINFRAPVINVYDRGRLSYVLLDELAKLPKDVPASQMLSIVLKTLIKGVKRVGFAELPSTVNEMTKAGGAEFKKIWDYADQFKKKPTVNRGVRFFQPAYEAYEGFIDEFGDSVVAEPTHEQYQYLVDKWVLRNEDDELISELSEEDIKLGARHYILVKRREGLTGIDLEEEIRMNPCDEEEAFMYAGQGCEFNSINIQKQIKHLEEEPVYLRQVRLVATNNVKKDNWNREYLKKEISFMDDEKGGWLILEKPNKENEYEDRISYLEPMNKSMYQIGVDTTKDDFAIHGSKPTICVFKKSCIIQGEEMGNYPVAFYVDKTRLDIHFDEEVLKACLWYGCTANYEVDARTDFYRYFCKERGQRLLEWTPKIAQDPVKFPLAKFKPGTQSADPFQLAAQLQVCKMYIDGTNPDEYNGHVHRIKFPSLLKQLLKYDHSERTPSDQVIALMMALLPVFGDQQAPMRPQRSQQILPTYKLKMPA